MCAAESCVFPRVGEASLPGKLVWGWGAAEKLAEFVRTNEIRNLLIVTDPGVVQAGILETPSKIIGSAAANIVLFDQVRPEPTLETVSAGLDRGKAAKVDAVVGIGGGSSLDVAKMVAVLLSYEKPIDQCLGMGNMPGKGLPLALVPTTTGTGSEVTQVCVLTDERGDGAKKVAYDPALLADLVIVDPAFSLNLPPKITALTALDALSHAIEPFVGNRRNFMADTFAREAIRRLSENIRPAVLRGASAPEARYNLAIGATLAGLALSCGGAGATHALTYPLAVKYHLGHGETIARLLPFVIRANMPADIDRFAEIATLVGADKHGDPMDRIACADAGVRFIEQLCRDVGAPMGISDLVDDDKDFAIWADIAIQFSGHNLKNNPRQFSRQEIIALYRSAREGVAQ